MGMKAGHPIQRGAFKQNLLTLLVATSKERPSLRRTTAGWTGKVGEYFKGLLKRYTETFGTRG
jgi:hypothetical protein